MDESTILTFERVALRVLRDMFPLFPGISITFNYLVVVGQTLIDQNNDDNTPGDERRRLDEDGLDATYELQVRFHVYADIYPGDPKNFDFQIFVASFFEIHYEDFLNAFMAETDFFSIQQPPGYGPQGPSNGENEVPEGGSFFAIRLLSALAAATLIVFLVSTLAVKRGRRHIMLKNSISNDFDSYEVSSGSITGEYISRESSDGIRSNEAEPDVDSDMSSGMFQSIKSQKQRSVVLEVVSPIQANTRTSLSQQYCRFLTSTLL